jgi:mono/diheme cytochrome c family protein
MYDVITNGVRNMPPYAQQISVRDRWAIVAYVRALQRSQYARPETLPESVVARIEEETGTTIGAPGDTTGTDPGEPTSD